MDSVKYVLSGRLSDYISNNTNEYNNGVTVNKAQLLKRRALEFKSENRKFYGLRRLFYHPKIHILDVDTKSVQWRYEENSGYCVHRAKAGIKFNRIFKSGHSIKKPDWIKLLVKVLMLVLKESLEMMEAHTREEIVSL
ncbi:hypothetical protein MACK_001757 [Theileria orientalis]|uniref:Uncharacterized protein n=1 Tax=Theileria orientalis TaxID=68886 RepID=A0A976MCM6_THEOR|nr:hypothetical protein MACK_001757 [Theileria orientalis]